MSVLIFYYDHFFIYGQFHLSVHCTNYGYNRKLRYNQKTMIFCPHYSCLGLMIVYNGCLLCSLFFAYNMRNIVMVPPSVRHLTSYQKRYFLSLSTGKKSLITRHCYIRSSIIICYCSHLSTLYVDYSKNLALILIKKGF